MLIYILNIQVGILIKQNKFEDALIVNDILI